MVRLLLAIMALTCYVLGGVPKGRRQQVQQKKGFIGDKRETKCAHKEGKQAVQKVTGR